MIKSFCCTINLLGRVDLVQQACNLVKGGLEKMVYLTMGGVMKVVSEMVSQLPDQVNVSIRGRVAFIVTGCDFVSRFQSVDEPAKGFKKFP